MRNIVLKQLFFCGLVFMGCLHWRAAAADTACNEDSERWMSLDRLPSFREPLAHPLIGRVYYPRSPETPNDACAGGELSRLAKSLRDQFSKPSAPDAPHLLVLGEVHDNPTHHILRAELLRSIFLDPHGQTPIPPTPAVVFEHIRADQQKAVDSVTASAGAEPSRDEVNKLFDALSWSTSGWPDQKMFEPLFSTVLKGRMPIFAGDAPAGMVNKVAFQGLDALPEADRALLESVGPFAPALRDALLTEIEEAHCGLMAKTHLGSMASAQRFRDSHLAEALSTASAKTGTAVLLTGNGHARVDRGAPSYFGGRGKPGNPISIMLIEVEDGHDDAAEYVPRSPSGEPAADIIIFTPRAERKDQCLEMKAQFSKSQK